MSIEQLSTARRARPFKPFTGRLANGRALLMLLPGFLAPNLMSRTFVGYDGASTALSVLDQPLVTELEYHNTGAASSL